MSKNIGFIPFTFVNTYGSIDAVFTPNVKGPISIVSIYGHVDVALPVATKSPGSFSPDR